MNAEIITIGDEILIGQILNTNTQFISEKLNSIGIFVDFQTTIGDDFDKIIYAIEIAFQRADLILITGGLGPTHDDITRDALCKIFKTELKLNEDVLKNIEQLLAKRNLLMTDLRKNQAMIPAKAIALENIFGTAPGLLFEEKNKILIAMPGVPYEMKFIFKNSVVPFLKNKTQNILINHKTLKTTGISESSLAEKIGDIKNLLSISKDASLAFLPSPIGVKLRITVKNQSEINSSKIISEIENKIKEKVSKYIFSDDENNLEDIICKLMIKNNFTLSVVESCTGGLLSNIITNVSGSSNFFQQSFVTYSNESKIKNLKIDPEIISKFGAVSFETAEVMAKNFREISNTTHSISITGIAGPTGGTSEKPIGLVFIGISDENETKVYKFNFADERERFKLRATYQALELLRRKILGYEKEI